MEQVMTASQVAAIAKTGPFWGDGYRPDKADTQGLKQYTFETGGGLVIECFLEYEKAEKQTYEHPGSPESCTLVWACVGDIDVSEIISDEWKATIEEEALQRMEAAADDDAADRAADRYEDRMADDAWMGPL
jgi:hypothetical protein